MKIAINVLPLKTGHKFRGVGNYTKKLIEELKKDQFIEVVEFVKEKELEESIDLIHYPWFDLFFHSLPIRSRYPSIVSIHDVMPLVFPAHYPVGIRGKVNNILQKIALSRCKYIITDSQTSKRDIVKYLGVKDFEVVVIPLAAGEEFCVLTDAQLIRIKRKYNLPNRFLLYVGDANWVKNLPFLIREFNELIKLNKFQDLKLVLVSNVFLKNVEDINHPELESLKIVNRLIKDNNLTDLIIRPGFVDTQDLVSLYNLATVYIQPSLYEGFGLPVLEAMACGTPVLCSNAGSLPEVGGKAAVYFNPEDPKQFINILYDVLEDKSLQSKLSDLGLKQAKKFSWKQTIEESKKVYFEAAKL